MTTCAEYRTRLADAQAALHSHMTGTRVIRLQHGEKSLQYDISTQGGTDRLQAYIQSLQRTVDACDGVSRGTRRGMLGIIPMDSNS